MDGQTEPATTDVPQAPFYDTSTHAWFKLIGAAMVLGFVGLLLLFQAASTRNDPAAVWSVVAMSLAGTCLLAGLIGWAVEDTLDRHRSIRAAQRGE